MPTENQKGKSIRRWRAKFSATADSQLTVSSQSKSSIHSCQQNLVHRSRRIGTFWLHVLHGRRVAERVNGIHVVRGLGEAKIGASRRRRLGPRCRQARLRVQRVRARVQHKRRRLSCRNTQHKGREGRRFGSDWAGECWRTVALKFEDPVSLETEVAEIVVERAVHALRGEAAHARRATISWK